MTSSRDRCCDDEKDERMRAPDTRLQPGRAASRVPRGPQPARCIAAGARSAGARARAGLGKGRFIFRRSLVVGSCQGSNQRWRTKPLGAAGPLAGCTAGGCPSLHVRLAAPAKPNNAATRATTMSWAELIRMHDPHASPWRHSAMPGCRRLAGPSSAEFGRPNIDFRVHGPYQFPPISAPEVEDSQVSRKLSRSRVTLEEPRPHRYSGSRRMCRPDRHARGQPCECGSMHRHPSGGAASASRVRLTASESARTVLYNLHHHAGPWLWLNHP
jgi:hypothetical protein